MGRRIGVAGVVVLLAAAAWGQERVVVRPGDNGVGLENPGMGWCLFYFDNGINNYGTRLAPSDTVDDFPGLTTIYLRLAWSFLEPEEGKFNWAIVDGPSQRWIAKGKKIAFRISCCESGLEYATPRWVEAAGAKGKRFARGKVDPNGRCWEPDYDDAVFLEKLDRFLAAFAGRYDGDPNVAFIDVGSFGVWGEGHTYWSTGIPFSAATVKRHIDLHVKHFKKTLLAANDDFASHGRGQEVIDYAAENGLTLRDDSIMVEKGAASFHSANMAQAFWPTRPVILESEHYGPSVKRGAWGDGSKYIEAMERYHASYAGIHWWPREFLKEQKELIDRMNLRLGYRMQVVEASWPAEVKRNGTVNFATSIRNGGVAPCLVGGRPAFTLKDEKGGIAAVFVHAGMDVKDLKVGAAGEAKAISHEAQFTLPPHLAAGEYQVFISIGSKIGTPELNLPLEGGDGQKRYRLGAIRIID